MAVRGRCRGSDDGPSDAGYVAVVAAILMPALIMLCAFAVDIARWYVEGEQQQKAVDAAALAGVPFIPQDFASAQAAALQIASNNGYKAGSGSIVVRICSSTNSYSSDGSSATGCSTLKPTQLHVEIKNTIPNFFASAFGFKDQGISRVATSDFNGPAPMGSPCNVFGNEPNTGTGSASEGGGTGPNGSAQPTTGAFANCLTKPSFWADIEGPNTLKVQGDQFMTRKCDSNNSGCSSSANGSTNSEFDPQGYYYLLRVLQPKTVSSIKVQVYDPEWLNIGQTCGSLPGGLTNNMNNYTTTDGVARYSNQSPSAFCTGDYNPGGYSGSPMITSFGVRLPTDTGNPAQGQGISGCAMQFQGDSSAPTKADLQKTNDLTRALHQWVTLCTVNPSALPGIDNSTPYVDYYIQARTNVKFGGTVTPASAGASISTGNTNVYTQAGDDPSVTGVGSNGFGMRAIVTDGTTSAGTKASIAGLQDMAMFMNVPNNTATFNLVRALPGAAGKYVRFSFFDPGDAISGSKFTVKLIRPTDATGSITSTASIAGCTGTGYVTGALPTCSVTSSSLDASGNNLANGHVETINAPVPSDYSCNYASQGGCWFLVQVTFQNASAVNDVTTWSASIDGDLVRLTQ